MKLIENRECKGCMLHKECKKDRGKLELLCPWLDAVKEHKYQWYIQQAREIAVRGELIEANRE